MREFLETQSLVQRQKAELVKFEGVQLKEAVSSHWAVSPLSQKHMVYLLRYGLGSQEWSILKILIALSKPPFQSVFV